MTCRAPLEASRRTGSKERPRIHNERPKTLEEGYSRLQLPCGQCISCRLEYSRQWAVRLIHEAAYWEEFHCRYSIFLTLTYDQENIPYGGVLVKHHAQDFLKRLRWHSGAQFRYYMVGEYGATCPDHDIVDCPMCGSLQRPHYHAVIFGWTPPDQTVVCQRDGQNQYTSEIIEKAWQKGSHEFGSCTFESCAYVARYVMKKQKGDNPHTQAHYQRLVYETGELIELPPEFAIMSRGQQTKRGGLGTPWYGKFKSDLYPMDETPIPGRGIIGKPPKFYDTMYEHECPEVMEKIKDNRRQAMATSLINGPSLDSRAKVQDARLGLYQRNL